VNQFATLNVDGIGCARWVLDEIDPETDYLKWVPCLGLWATDGRFFVVLPPQDLKLRDLAAQIANAQVDVLPYHYRERDLPNPGEAEGWHGQCRMRGRDHEGPVK